MIPKAEDMAELAKEANKERSTINVDRIMRELSPQLGDVIKKIARSGCTEFSIRIDTDVQVRVNVFSSMFSELQTFRFVFDWVTERNELRKRLRDTLRAHGYIVNDIHNEWWLSVVIPEDTSS